MGDSIKDKTFTGGEFENGAEATTEIVPSETEKSTENKDIETRETPQHTIDLMAILKVNGDLLQGIKDTIQNRLEYDAVKEKAIDKINDELRFYRDGFVFQSQKSIFIDIMMLYDSLERILQPLANEETFSKNKLKEQLEMFKEELLEILCRRDINPFNEHPEYLNYKLHKTVKTIPTDKESENNMVDQITKIGFRWNDKILRPEEVIIKKYVKP